jgi:PAS domain S-box-containing protein
VNQAIVRIRSRDELLSTVCRLLVERGAVDLAWIGWLDPVTFRISPVAHFGNQAQMLSEVHFYADDNPARQGNTGRSIREGKPFVCNECDSRQCLYAGGQAPTQFGFQSCGSFPFRFQGEVCGTLTLCTAERGFFQKREIELVHEVALDISFALDKIESDIQRDRLNEQYQEQSVFLRSLIDAMPCQVFYKDTELRYLGCNKAYEQILRLDRDQIIGRTAHDIWPEDLADLYSRADRRLLADPDQQGVTHEEIVETPEGIRRYYLTNKAIFRSQEGAIGGIIGTTMDITERRVAEAAIQKSEAKFRSYIENSPLAVLVADREGRILDFNRAAIDLLGYDAATLAGMSVEKIHLNEDREIFLQDFATLFHKGHVEVERRVKRAGGEVRWVALNASMIDDQLCLGCCQDITERKRVAEERTRIETQLRQAQKMEALGTLAGGIAHDFNNILGIIMGFTQLAMYELGQGIPVMDKLGEVIKASNRAKDLVKQILAFSRRSEQQKMPLQLGIIVKEAMQILRPSLPSTIEIKTDVSTKSNILADPTQMHQVLMNLCTNAAHAMQDNGGILEVTLAGVVLQKEHVPHPEDLQPGPYVKLTVKDTGHGIDPAIINSIFDPFFTTKQSGEGTGLGLSVVHGILKSHGGCISVDSTPGKGTKFTVLIPVLETDYALDKAEADIPLPQGRERVLVVDDEPLLADMVKQMLENQGYDVVSRTSGIEALEAFRHQPAEMPFDLVITDMTMPHFTGADLARELSALNPEVPVILMTGFSVKIDADRAKEMGIEGFLMKPVATAELAAMVRTVLDQRTK